MLGDEEAKDFGEGPLGFYSGPAGIAIKVKQQLLHLPHLRRCCVVLLIVIVGSSGGCHEHRKEGRIGVGHPEAAVLLRAGADDGGWDCGVVCVSGGD